MACFQITNRFVRRIATYARRTTLDYSTVCDITRRHDRLVRDLAHWPSCRRFMSGDLSQNDGEDKLTILPATTSEDYEFITRMCKISKRPIGPHTITHVGPVIKPGFLVGWLNGARVGCGSACMFGGPDSNVVYHGLVVINPSLRRNRYGDQMIEAVATQMPGYQLDHLNIAGSNTPVMASRMEKVYNVTTRIQSKIYTVSCSNIIQALQPTDCNKQHSASISPSNGMVTNIKLIDQVDFDKLSVYDTSVFGFPRREFLQRWITIPQSTGFVATNENGDIVGYSVMQPSFVKEQLLIGPLFSDNEAITRSLLYTLAKAAIDPQMGGASTVRLMVPTEVNPGAADLIEKVIGCDSFDEMIRLYTKGIPPSQVDTMNKVVAVSAPAFD